jgi:hypothetical protein
MTTCGKHAKVSSTAAATAAAAMVLLQAKDRR